MTNGAKIADEAIDNLAERIKRSSQRRDSVRRDGCNAISLSMICRARPWTPAFAAAGARERRTNGNVSLVMELAQYEAFASE